MQETGGATLIAHVLTELMAGASPGQVLSAVFLLLALLSNVLSTKATAVLFTPIAVDLARILGVPVEAFAVAVIFASNCSFASPIGFHPTLLLMYPAPFRFFFFLLSFIPLIFLFFFFFLFSSFCVFFFFFFFFFFFSFFFLNYIF